MRSPLQLPRLGAESDASKRGTVLQFRCVLDRSAGGCGLFLQYSAFGIFRVVGDDVAQSVRIIEEDAEY
jgi:hypothetical protein